MAKILIHCATRVKRDAIRRENIGGVEHIIISSMTLPNDIIMNGIMYPAAEVDKGISTLDMTLAPIEHPQDLDGNYISANLPHAIHNYHAGAYNTNVKRDGDRISVDKYINVIEANKTDRGKRLLDRIHEIETNDDARPIHTSVGVWLDAEQLPNPIKVVNGAQAGVEYSFIARDMEFDHDAILLDNIAAAQPHQGVGMAVNKDGEKCDVQFYLNDAPAVNDAHMFYEERRDKLQLLIDNLINDDDQWAYVFDFNDTRILYRMDGIVYAIDYNTGPIDGQFNIVGIQQAQSVTYTPTTNQKGDDMKLREIMLNLLKEKKVDVSVDITDDDLVLKYNAAMVPVANADDGAGDDTAPVVNGDTEGLAAIVTAAMKPLIEKITALETNSNKAATDELDMLANTVATSGLYPGLDAENAKLLGVNTLKTMAVNCQSSVGIGFALNSSEGGAEKAPEMQD